MATVALTGRSSLFHQHLLPWVIGNPEAGLLQVYLAGLNSPG